jgi:hypothetical protein
LVGDPFGRWVGGDAQPEDLSPAVPHDQQSIEKPEGNGRHYEQIHRRNTIRMIAQERLPALRRRPPPAYHILGNAGLADLDAKLEQFAMDPGSAPQRIGDAHLPD